MIWRAGPGRIAGPCPNHFDESKKESLGRACLSFQALNCRVIAGLPGGGPVFLKSLC